MRTLQIKYSIYLLVFTLLVGTGIGVLMHHVFPSHFPPWYVATVVFFFITSLATLFLTNDKGKKSDRWLVNMYLLTGIVRFVLSLLFLTAFALLLKDEKRSFGVIFILLFFLYTLFDLSYLFKVEKWIKTTNTIEQ
ncbi:MAG: hypothetical protein LBR67_02890 [Dysgonamonadaceae bacterium]|jgi:FtsH-binding integral membrane protein|nr:hypothetical protein [Dysgonamonadaceae bacterium]